MKAAGISPQPYVMNAVLFARKATDFSEVAKHASEGGKGRVVDIDSFISAAKSTKRLDALIGEPEFDSRPKGLTDKSGRHFQALRNFFTVGRDFGVADTSYAAYRAKDEAISKARLWTHYEASSDNSFGDVALLRLWNFDADEGLSIDDADRETLVNREGQDAAGLVLKLFDAANDYEEALGRRGALEPVFVRTRRLICGTCVGLGDEKLNLASQAFDLVVVDEAARAQGSEMAIPLANARKALLVGDQKQLEPFLDSETIRRAAEALSVDDAELAMSDFARAFESPYGKTASAQLDIQYRMAPSIGELVSDIFYDGKLRTGRPLPKREWNDLPWPFDASLSWVDVAGAETSAAGRVRNNAEVEDVVESLELLASSSVGNRLLSNHEACGVSEAFVGVIAMYAEQVTAIRQRVANSSLDRRWREQVKIGTVDSYQGKENSIVLVSLVRDNPRGAIGFLRKENRVNVALSRAKERLVIFGARRMFERSDSKLQQALSHPSLVDRIAPLKKSNLAAE